MTARVVILTGERGVGKSTVCERTVALARDKGYTCGGLLTLSRTEGSLDVLDVRSGDVRRLTLPPDVEPAIVQGRFRFDPGTLAWGNAVLAHATPCHLLVVDELGPLEMERGGGWAKAFAALRGNNFGLALVVVRPELLTRAQMRLSVSATTVLGVTPDNRDGLPGVLLTVLEREISPSARI